MSSGYKAKPEWTIPRAILVGLLISAAVVGAFYVLFIMGN